MTTARLEAFSDGVLAIIITIMVLELRPPDGTELSDLRDLWPVFLSYLLSFVYVGIYWNNHHHLFHAAERINGAIMWANLALLFCLSLFPFATAWMGEHSFAPDTAIAYGVVALMAALSYYVLQRVIIREHGRDSRMAQALGNDLKGKISPVIYLASIGAAHLSKWVALAGFILVAIMWVVPDRRLVTTTDEG
jgi:uncharacterized membrane protein